MRKKKYKIKTFCQKFLVSLGKKSAKFEKINYFRKTLVTFPCAFNLVPFYFLKFENVELSYKNL